MGRAPTVMGRAMWTGYRLFPINQRLPRDAIHRRSSRAQVAQLVEQWTENPCVGGSIPPLGTMAGFAFVPSGSLERCVAALVIDPDKERWPAAGDGLLGAFGQLRLVALYADPDKSHLADVDGVEPTDLDRRFWLLRANDRRGQDVTIRHPSVFSASTLIPGLKAGRRWTIRNPCLESRHFRFARLKKRQ